VLHREVDKIKILTAMVTSWCLSPNSTLKKLKHNEGSRAYKAAYKTGHNVKDGKAKAKATCSAAKLNATLPADFEDPNIWSVGDASH